MLIAAATVMAGFDARLRPLVPRLSTRFAHAALRATGGAILRSLVGGRGGRFAARLLERAILPGIVAHYALRKRAIEREVRCALAEGCGRVVVLGAGLDSLAWRLAAEGTPCVELDHAATQHAKRRVIAALGGAPRALRLVEADLSHPAAIGLLRDTVSPAPVVVVEGVLMYLPRGTVDAVLSSILGLPAGRLILTFMGQRANGAIGFERGRGAIIGAWLRARGEPFAWGASVDDVREMLRSSGWRLTRVIETSDECTGAAAGAPKPPRGESIAIADPA